MKTIKIVSIVVAFIAVIFLIYWAVKKAGNKDVVTGVDNDKIQKSAEASGVPKPIAEAIAKAPDSSAAAQSVGISPIVATAIANGITIPYGANTTVLNERIRPYATTEGYSSIAPTYDSLGKVIYVGAITNTPQGCPQGTHQVKNSDGTYGCVADQS